MSVLHLIGFVSQPHVSLPAATVRRLLFSQSLLTLDMVEKMLEECDERAQAVDPETALVDPLDPFRDCHNSWVPGFDYFRMDGSTNVDLRTRWIEMFNDPANLRGRLFLISTKAGSLGTNLVGANRVVLMDASWNPTHDVQAIFRVYRFGQKKPVFIYRLLAQVVLPHSAGWTRVALERMPNLAFLLLNLPLIVTFSDQMSPPRVL